MPDIIISKESQLKRYYNKHTNTYEFMRHGVRLDIELLFDFDKPNSNVIAACITAEGKNIRVKNIDCNLIKCKNVNIIGDANVFTISSERAETHGIANAYNIYTSYLYANNQLYCWNLEATNIDATDIIAYSYIKCNNITANYVYTNNIRAKFEVDIRDIRCIGSVFAKSINCTQIHAKSIEADSILYHIMTVEELDCDNITPHYDYSNYMIINQDNKTNQEDENMDKNLQEILSGVMEARTYARPEDCTHSASCNNGAIATTGGSVICKDINKTPDPNADINKSTHIPYHNYISYNEAMELCKQEEPTELTFTSEDQMAKYYNKKTSEYVFANSIGDLLNVNLMFDFVAGVIIRAGNIRGKIIEVSRIYAWDIVADSIICDNINAGNIRSNNLESVSIVADDVHVKNLDCNWIKADKITATTIRHGDMVFSYGDIVCHEMKPKTKDWSVVSLKGDTIIISEMLKKVEESNKDIEPILDGPVDNCAIPVDDIKLSDVSVTPVKTCVKPIKADAMKQDFSKYTKMSEQIEEFINVTIPRIEDLYIRSNALVDTMTKVIANIMAKENIKEVPNITIPNYTPATPNHEHCKVTCIDGLEGGGSNDCLYGEISSGSSVKGSIW